MVIPYGSGCQTAHDLTLEDHNQKEQRRGNGNGGGACREKGNCSGQYQFSSTLVLLPVSVFTFWVAKTSGSEMDTISPISLNCANSVLSVDPRTRFAVEQVADFVGHGERYFLSNLHPVVLVRLDGDQRTTGANRDHRGLPQ